MQLDKAATQPHWWVIIGPDSLTHIQPGAFDLQTFLKKRMALAASVTR